MNGLPRNDRCGFRGTSRAIAWMALFVVFIYVDQSACAQDYPNHLIRTYMGFPAGTYLDIVTRHFTDRLAQLSGQTVIVENKVGAGGMMAMEAGARAKPDGYTLVFGPGLSASVFQFKSLAFDPVKDFTRVSTIVAFPFVLLVNPRTTSATNVAELVQVLKTKSKVSYGAPNTLSLIAGALFANAEAIEATAVQYKSTADAVRDLNAGDLEFMFVDSGFALAQMRDGRLRGLAVTLPQRTPNAPDLPTMVEAGVPDVSFFGWMGVYLPTGAPPEAAAKLAHWLGEIDASEETRAFFQRIGADPFYKTPDEFTRFEAEEFKRWRERARLANVEAQ
jgi:tripartite-type tricarboxylate transporter receptor subunit TctC